MTPVPDTTSSPQKKSSSSPPPPNARTENKSQKQKNTSEINHDSNDEASNPSGSSGKSPSSSKANNASNDTASTSSVTIPQRINAMFPQNTPLSLSHLNSLITKTQSNVNQLQRELVSDIRLQMQQKQQMRLIEEFLPQQHGEEGNNQAQDQEQTQESPSTPVHSQLHSTQQMIQQLLSQIHMIHQKSLLSEQKILSITSQIKSLDLAKGNLTRTIGMLRRWYMMGEAVENLRILVRRCYQKASQHNDSKNSSSSLVTGINVKENERIAQLLAAINDLQRYFTPKHFGTDSTSDKDAHKKSPLNTSSAESDFHPQLHKIHEMRQTVSMLKESLSHHLIAQFKSFFQHYILANDASSREPPTQPQQLELHHACEIINQINESTKQDLIQLFVQSNMKSYEAKFGRISGDASPEQSRYSGLEYIPKRYSWCKKQLRLYKMRYEKIFPSNWCVPQEFVVEFCLQTRAYIQNRLQEEQSAAGGIDAQVLHKALLNTIKFERDMHAKFHLQTQFELDQQIRQQEEQIEKLKDEASRAPKTSESIQMRWKLMQHEKKLSQLKQEQMRQQHGGEFGGLGAGDMNQRGTPGSVASPTPLTPISARTSTPTPSKHAVAKNYRFLQFISTCFEEYMDAYVEFEDKNMGKKVELILERETWDPTDSNNSAQDLFIYISESLRNCRAFSQGKTLYTITQTLWKKHIHNYADNLIKKLPKLSTQNSSSFAKFNFLKDIMAQGDSSSGSSVLSEHQLLTVCHIIQMADYCQEELDQTQDVLYQVIDEQYRNRITFSEEKGKFYKVLKSSIEVIVMSLMNSIEGQLQTMSKMPWGTYNSVGDQSEYVMQLTETLGEEFPRVASELPSEHFQFMVDSFIITMTHAFQDYLSKCKKISNAGAQQLLLDVTHIKKFLKHLYEMHPQSEELFDEDDVAAYVRKLNRQVSRVEDVLREILLAPISNK